MRGGLVGPLELDARGRGCSTAGEVESVRIRSNLSSILHRRQTPRRNENFCTETETGGGGGRKGPALHTHGLIYPGRTSEPVRLPEVFDG